MLFCNPESVFAMPIRQLHVENNTTNFSSFPDLTLIAHTARIQPFKWLNHFQNFGNDSHADALRRLLAKIARLRPEGFLLNFRT